MTAMTRYAAGAKFTSPKCRESTPARKFQTSPQPFLGGVSSSTDSILLTPSMRLYTAQSI